MQFEEAVRSLDRWCRTRELAESWDNVGLLIQPPSCVGCTVTKVLVCVDATSEVVLEARAAGAKLLVAYHPAIFSPMKRITPSSGSREAVVALAMESGLAVYSPHTALDAMAGGINDWLARGLGRGSSVPLRPTAAPAGDGTVGVGRLLTLEESVTLPELARRLGVTIGAGGSRCHVRVAGSNEREIRRVAICAGSGADVFKGVAADAFVTGELSHHLVLDLVERGCCVALSEHTATERGFMSEVLRPALADLFGPKVDVSVSKTQTELITLAQI